MQIHLKKGEKIYVNGAVIKADHRCSLEFLNNVTFLLENHVMQAEKAETPFKQVYFVVQTMLIDPENAQVTRELYWHLSGCLHTTVQNPHLIDGLTGSDTCVKNQRYFDALKILRGLFAVESKLLDTNPDERNKTNRRKEVA
jgi:flagellar biosynthesis repressor protein FlbT